MQRARADRRQGKVLHVCEPTTAGAALVAFNLAAGLRRHGIESVVCTPPGSLSDWCRDAGVPVIPLAVERRCPWSYLLAMRAIRRTVLEGDYTVVHAHSSFAGALVRLAWNSKFPPVVFQPHAWSFLAVRPLFRPPVKALERLLARRTELLLCVSGEELLLAAEAGIRPKRSVVISNGIDFDSAQLRSSRELSPEPVAGCVARLSWQKGVDVLLRAVASAKWPGRLSVEIVGTGPQRANLQALAHQLGVAERVRFLGFSEDVRPYLERWDLFVLPSRYEGLPFTLLESVAAGLPVIATAGAAVSELMGESPGVVPIEDPEALAAAVAHALSDWDATVRDAGIRRAAASEKYSLDAQLEQTALAYSELPQGALLRTVVQL